MSRRVTPIAFMDSDRYSTYIEVRRKALRRERALRYAGAVVAVFLPALVAFIVLGLVGGP